MGFVLSVEGWIIIVIILLFLLTPGAMLSTLNTLFHLIPQQLCEAGFFFFFLVSVSWKKLVKFRKASSLPQVTQLNGGENSELLCYDLDGGWEWGT